MPNIEMKMQVGSSIHNSNSSQNKEEKMLIERQEKQLKEKVLHKRKNK